MQQREHGSLASLVKQVFTLRWRPGRDLLAVAVSWLLVTGTLYIATNVVGSTVAGGMAYFFLYAVLTATAFGLGIPLIDGGRAAGVRSASPRACSA
jgi:hypothetical protein